MPVKDVAGALGVFLVETDRTLVDSYLSPAALVATTDFSGHPWQLEPVYVDFHPAQHNSQESRPGKDRNRAGKSATISHCVVQRAWRETA
jgi:hypothetical protein